MRDVLNTFGTQDSKTSAADFPNGVDTLAANSLGIVDSLYVKIKITKNAPSTADTITVVLKDGADASTSKALLTHTFPAALRAVGDELKVKVPVEHLRYLTLAASTGVAGVGLCAYLERG